LRRITAEGKMVDSAIERLIFVYQERIKIRKEAVVDRNRIDLLIIGKALIAIEFKRDLFYWPQGIQQATHHLKAVDYSSLCIPYMEEVPEEIILAAKNNNIGLLLFNETGWPVFTAVVRPPRSKIKTKRDEMLLRFKSQTVKLPKHHWRSA
jgi:hypothetical protein